jgi:uncharacterized protein
MKIVLDANVVVAAFAARGLCESVFEVCVAGHEVLLSEALLDEVRRNLARKVKLDGQAIANIDRLLRESGTILEPATVAVGTCRDSDDLHVLGLAKTAQADYIVTGDLDLLVLKRFGRCRIVTPRQFWSRVHRP